MDPESRSPAGGIANIAGNATWLNPEKADKQLSKFAAIWLWSVILGSTSGLLWSSYIFRLEPYGHLYGYYSIIFLIPSLASMAFSFRALLSLRSMLFSFILPEFFAMEEDRTTRNPYYTIAEVRKNSGKTAVPVGEDIGNGGASDSESNNVSQARSRDFSRHTRSAVNAVIGAAICKISVDVLMMVVGTWLLNGK
jgi:hypothetical protein